MKHFIRLWIAPFVCCLMSSSAAGDRSSNEDRNVLSAVEDAICHRRSTGYAILSSETSFVQRVFVPEELGAPITQSLVARNAERARLPLETACGNLRKVRQSELDSYLSKPEGWAEFFDAFPGASGILFFSLPGYSADGNVAVVQIEGVCGWTCGSGSFWVLEKENDRWKVKRTIPGWQS